MSLSSMCNSLGEVRRATNVPDGKMGFTKSWDVVYPSVRLSVQLASARDVDRMGVRGAVATHKLYATSALELLPEDVIVVDGLTYKYVAGGTQVRGRGGPFVVLARLES